MDKKTEKKNLDILLASERKWWSKSSGELRLTEALIKIYLGLEPRLIDSTFLRQLEESIQHFSEIEWGEGTLVSFGSNEIEVENFKEGLIKQFKKGN